MADILFLVVLIGVIVGGTWLLIQRAKRRRPPQENWYPSFEAVPPPRPRSRQSVVSRPARTQKASASLQSRGSTTTVANSTSTSSDYGFMSSPLFTENDSSKHAASFSGHGGHGGGAGASGSWDTPSPSPSHDSGPSHGSHDSGGYSGGGDSGGGGGGGDGGGGGGSD
jgi:uncharacterized membrane protein YgcG